MGEEPGRLRPTITGLLVMLAIVACATTTSQTTPTTTAPTPASSTPDPLDSPTVDGLYEVDEDGRRLHLTCWGEGSPTVILEAGHLDGAGISDFGGSGAEFTRAIAAETRVCAYGRAGWDGSDPAPNEPRDADDVIHDLHNLLGAAEVDGPYVMVGSSFGWRFANDPVAFPAPLVVVTATEGFQASKTRRYGSRPARTPTR